MDSGLAKLLCPLSLQRLREDILALDVEITRCFFYMSDHIGEMNDFKVLAFNCRKLMRKMELNVRKMCAFVQQLSDVKLQQHHVKLSSIFEIRVSMNHEILRRVVNEKMGNDIVNKRTELFQQKRESLALPTCSACIYPARGSGDRGSVVARHVKSALETLNGIVRHDSLVKNTDINSLMHLEEAARHLQHLQGRLEISVRLMRKYRQRSLTTGFLVLYSLIVFAIVTLAILFNRWPLNVLESVTVSTARDVKLYIFQPLSKSHLTSPHNTEIDVRV
uniref:Uncharacterized protein n=1 Tax=Trichuris muris TaxID=70415 RepID=A0A5S6QT15_TRIMR